MIGYKVIYGGRGHLESYIINGEYVVKYEIGKKAYPAIGKLFVFDTLENAREFAGHGIFKCRFKKSKYQRKYIPTDRRSGAIELFWRNNIRSLRSQLFFIHPPEGTIFADWVELIEEVM